MSECMLQVGISIKVIRRKVVATYSIPVILVADYTRLLHVETTTLLLLLLQILILVESKLCVQLKIVLRPEQLVFLVLVLELLVDLIY